MVWKHAFILLSTMLLLISPVSAQESITDPGITPDSPFYFIDKMFSIFKSPKSLANERASEIIAMAEKGHEKGLAIAARQYAKAVARLQEKAEQDETIAEEATRLLSNHIVVLSRVREKVPEQARSTIDNVIVMSEQRREDAMDAVAKHNPERASNLTRERLLRNKIIKPKAL